RLHDVAVEDGERVAVVDVPDGVEGRAHEDAVQVEADGGEPGAAGGEGGVEVVAGGDARQRLHRPQRVVGEHTAEVAQLDAAQAVGRGGGRIGGVERRRLHEDFLRALEGLLPDADLDLGHSLFDRYRLAR